MRRLLLLALVTLYSQAQRTFQNTQFDISGDLPSEDPAVLAQAEGVPTHVNKNDLKPVKLQKPAELAVSSPVSLQGPAAVQPLPPQGPAPTLPLPLAPVPAAPAPPPQPFTLPPPPSMPTFAPFTFPTFSFPTHPPLPTLAPFTLPTLPPHPTPAPFTFPTPAPAPGSPPVPQVADYDDASQKSLSTGEQATPAPATAPPTPFPQPQPQPQLQPQPQQPPAQQTYYYTPEYIQYIATNFPEHYRQNYQYYLYYSQPRPAVPPQVPQQPQQPQPQLPLAQQSLPAQTQPLHLQPPQPQLTQQPIQAQPAPQIQVTAHGQPLSPMINVHPSAAGVATVAQEAAPSNNRPQVIKMERAESNTSPSRASNWFREQADTAECKRDLKKVAKLFKEKFPAYLQKGGKDAALAELVEKRLVECDEKSRTGHWEKVDGLLSKIQLSKSEESDCRSGLIQERISCQNLLNFSCQFTNNHYQFKLVPARIVIQEARQAEAGAEKCRKVVRLVKKRLEG